MQNGYKNTTGFVSPSFARNDVREDNFRHQKLANATLNMR